MTTDQGAAAPFPSSRDALTDDLLTPQEAWQNLMDKDDRNSPAEYQDMCLITAKELADYMRRASADVPQAQVTGTIIHEHISLAIGSWAMDLPGTTNIRHADRQALHEGITKALEHLGVLRAALRASPSTRGEVVDRNKILCAVMGVANWKVRYDNLTNVGVAGEITEAVIRALAPQKG